jgi:hypothetical protein
MRVIDADIRRALEAQDSDHVILTFMTVEHEFLSEPLRVVNDVVDYVLDGATYQGILFGFKLLPDGEEIPTTDIVIPNVDKRIGRVLRPLGGRAKVSVVLHSSADFDLTQFPRVQIGTPSVIWSINRFDLIEVDHNEVEVTGKLILRDPSQEQWPGISATRSRLPGLWR